MKDIYKNWLSEEDFTKPFRLVAPKYSLVTLRFSDEEKATEALNACKDMGIQGILSKIDTNKVVTNIIGYSREIRAKAY